MHASTVVLALSLAILSAGAHAQEPVAQPPAAEQIVLRVEQGQVMTSSGGEFVPAQTGTVLQPGDRIMVTDDAAASVFFGDACRADYSVPGVHVVERRCDGAADSARAQDFRTPALIAGAVAVVALAVSGGGGDDDPAPPPVSR